MMIACTTFINLFSLSGTSIVDLTETHDEETTQQANRLIGTSSERASLRETQDREYAESLHQDQCHISDDDSGKSDGNDPNENLTTLQTSRLERVMIEPGDNEPRVQVVVRHINLGRISRYFRKFSLFLEVYDWVGSLSAKPPYFSLISYGGDDMKADRKVESGIFNMKVLEEPYPMSPEVTFNGYECPFPSLESPEVKSKFYDLDRLNERKRSFRDKLQNDILG